MRSLYLGTHPTFNTTKMNNEKLREDFLLEFDKHTFCNHGSYGAPPKCVFNLRQSLLATIESDVEKWDRFKLIEHYKKACGSAADFIEECGSDIYSLQSTV